MIPNHIAFILDGNRRHARKKGRHPWKGHVAGAENLRKVLKWCDELGVQEVTLYVFSMQNFTRDKKEVEKLMEIFVKEAEKVLDSEDFQRDYGVRIRFIGRKHLLPEAVRDRIQEIEDRTKDKDERFLNVAMAYGGREEITDAVRRIAENAAEGKIKPEGIDEDYVAGNLYMDSEPDMIIRTGGVRRTSNFLPWQSIYSEWFFVDRMWPEFTKEDLISCIEEFKNRERRFGK